MEVVSLPPNAPVLMEATRAIGYSIETAVADIIDNSVTAHATEVHIMFFPIGNPYVAIMDNGSGMNEDEIKNAMRYGSKNPLDTRASGDLGRFGLGLKTASMSQCRRLTVISKKNDAIVGAQWDLDFIESTNDWSLKLLDSDDVADIPHIDQLKEKVTGTLVVWQALDRLSLGDANFDQTMGKYMDLVREHLSLVFHRYLAGEQGIKKIEIFMNNVKLEPIDPFLSSKSTQVMADESISIEGHKVMVRPYTLPHISQLSESDISMLGGKDGLRKLQGFYVYRNKRLLVWGTWFRLMRQGDLSKLARVRVDIPNSLDYLWTLDIKKSIAVPPEAVRRNLAGIIGKISESSKRTWVFRGKKETDESKIHIWNRVKARQGGIFYEINRDHPLVEAVSSNAANKQLVEKLLQQIERSLPLNQLYIDLTNDERIVNENEVSQSDLSNLLEQLLAGCRDVKEREMMLKRLASTEPFNQQPELLRDLI
ncbi:ATP-binding protein [Cohnella sp. AR92]|uniref:ATP-binding protein n=1 Tax=Cohnella sp. AR92 TaxID=648716 RepID=UPI000F8D75D3|nr:ATP-binding protein [Cohnella sp. AR92]RUS48855.1 ATP-binding protein [Cohnella sp. AR92]